MPNELLKHSGLQSRLYIMDFLNQILEEGRVPEELNVGKCVLLHKVRQLIDSIFPSGTHPIAVHQ